MAVNCLFAEFDYKDFDNDKERTKMVIRKLPIAPSYVVRSGGGYHLYWLLDEPWHMDRPDILDEAKRLQADWVAFVGGDEGAKDLARVLRLPGTKNYKYDPARDVELVPQVDIHRYRINQFRDAIDAVFVATDPVAETPEEETDEISRALMYLNSLADHRREDYQSWLEVGISLSILGEVGLLLWDNWSKKSSKYKLGECSIKWRGFEPGDGITLESLKFWAQEDNPEGIFDLPQAPKKPKPSDYMRAMKSAGWTFQQNEANYDIELNGMPINEALMAIIYTSLFEKGYRERRTAQDCWITLGFQNSYHPVLDYLDRLEWDGEDHIETLASYFSDKNGVFEQWITRWLIGAVARVAAYPRGQQNRMLVLDGKQNLGKSYFVRWLADDVPDLHLEGAINPEDKDDSIRLMSVWLWEVAELGSTFRKADREALKFFISKEKVQVRKSYGRIDTRRPAMSSFVGTINNEAGFLSDPTGSRRFMVSTLTTIDWNYATEVDVSQVWAQAYALFKKGEPWHLTKEEAIMAADLNTDYEIENPIEDYLLRNFKVDPIQKDDDWFLPTINILDILRTSGNISGNDRFAAMQIGAALKKRGCEKERKRINGRKVAGWQGVQQRFAGQEQEEPEL